MSYYISFEVGDPITEEYMCYYATSFTGNEVDYIFIRDRATNIMWPIKTLSCRSTFSTSTYLVDPPKELIDLADLLNGQTDGRMNPADYICNHYTNKAILLRVDGIFSGDVHKTKKIHHRFEFFKVKIVIKYQETSSLKNSTADRAIKL